MSKHKHAPKSQRPAPSRMEGFSPIVRDLLAVLLLYLVTVVLFREIIFSRMAFSTQGDTIAALSYQRTGSALQAAEGTDILWMPGFFSGMPTFGNLSYIPHDVNYVQHVALRVLNWLYLDGPWTWFLVFFLLGGVFMYALVRSFEIPRPAAFFAACVYMLNPFAVGLAGEGHGSKLMALTYLPLLLLLTSMLYRRRDLLSAGLLAAAIGTFFLSNHLQIVYYGAALLGFYLVYLFVTHYRRTPAAFAGGTALFIGALIVGGCIASYIYLSVYEYAPFSIRGGGTAGSSGGLDWNYATNWSWHPAELVTLFIPGFFGLQASTYWGLMTPWQNSSVYIGLLPLLFAAVALWKRRTPLVIFLAVMILIVVLVSFGRNFAVLFDLLFSILPFFNKFRAPAMILHLLPLLLGLLGAIGFAALAGDRQTREKDRAQLLRAALIGTGIFGAIAFGALLLKGSLLNALSGALFVRESDLPQLQQQYGQRAAQVMAQLQQMRFDIFWKDLVKFGFIGAAGCGILWGFLSGKLRRNVFVVLVVALGITDLWLVSGKYVTPEPAGNVDAEFRPDATVAYLKQQPGTFRVFPVGPIFMDNSFAYHGLQSIGGYSPAKLKIYQTLIDSSLERPLSADIPWNMNVLNMLNTEYLVVPGLLPENPYLERVYTDQNRRLVTYRNAQALPRAWFVRDIVIAGNDSEVFARLNSPGFNPATTAILYRAPSEACGSPDSGATVSIRSAGSRRIVLTASTTQRALCVVSEVYYPAGWTATIDGLPVEILRTNYCLRSVVVPPGTHEIVFTFDPPVYRTGWILSNTGWVVALLAILLGLWPMIRTRIRRSPPATPTN